MAGDTSLERQQELLAGATPEQLDEILAGLNANTQELSDAVVANTPAA